MPEFEFITEGGRATFTPLGTDGRPAGEPRTFTVHSIEPVYIKPLHDMADAIRTIPAAVAPLTVSLTNLGSAPGEWALFYELFMGKRWRPTKTDRRKAKRRKLDQRRAARAGREPGEDWRKAMDLYTWSVAETARGVKTRPHPRTGYVHIAKGDNNNE